MLLIGFEQFVILIVESLNVLGKLCMELPELRVGAVPHKSRQRPSRRSRMASSASASRCPAATSASNCLSHAAASNSENQSRKTESSWRESLLTAASIFIGELSGGQERKIIVDLGLSAMLLFGMFIAIFVGVGLVYKEIERRTIYAVFSKPVRRRRRPNGPARIRSTQI